MQKIRVAVVGGGRTGTPLIDDLLRRPFVELVGVADVDTDSPGSVLARDNGVFVTSDFEELASMGDGVDIIIEVSGDPEVKPKLKNAFVVQGNRTTIIMQDIVARLIMSIVADSDVLLESVHPEDRGIG